MFEFNWIEVPFKSPAHWACTFAELEIFVGNACLTSHVNNRTRSLDKRVILPLYELAEWLALNRFFLLAETNERNINFKQRHDISIASSGFAFPSITVINNGDYTLMNCVAPDLFSKDIQFVTFGQFTIKTKRFFSDVDSFLDIVISRLNSSGIGNTFLEQIVNNFNKFDKEELNFSIVSAKMGLYPEQISEQDSDILIDFERDFGLEFTKQLLSAAGPSIMPALHHLKNEINLYKSNSIIHWKRPSWADELRSDTSKIGIPYKRGYALANKLSERKKYNGGNILAVFDSIGNDLDIEIKLEPHSLFEGISGISIQDRKVFNILSKKGRYTDDYFIKARLLGDLFYNGVQKISALTDGKEPRQQFNRAFAAELLLPKEYLQKRLPSSRQYFFSEELDTIAEERQLNPRMVYIHAHNHGMFQWPQSIGEF